MKLNQEMEDYLKILIDKAYFRAGNNTSIISSILISNGVRVHIGARALKCIAKEKSCN